jgi:hypothetical protein
MTYAIDQKGIVHFALYSTTYAPIKKRSDKTDPKPITKNCYTEAEKDNLVKLYPTATVTPLDQPTADLTAKLQGKTFDSWDEAKVFIDANGIVPPSELDNLNDAVQKLILAQLGG